MYFEDLTPYEYGREPLRDKVLNVGWLSRDHGFSTGDSSEALVRALRRLVLSPVNLYRGLHFCEFCPAPRQVLSPSGLSLAEPLPGTSGNGEIRVAGKKGVIYVAPVLVAHYVEAHRYFPPAEFVQAVMALDNAPDA